MRIDEILTGRLQQVALLLLWEGEVSNERLRGLFDLSQVRASEWIKEFRAHFPDSCEWHSRRRRFLASSQLYQQVPSERPALSLSQYLALSTRQSTLQSDPHSAIFQGFQAIGQPSARVVSRLQLAIRTSVGVNIQYVSLNQPEPHWRVLFPHSLVCTGQRWHVRGFSPEHGEYRDHNLGRILDIALSDEVLPAEVAPDQAWQTLVQIELGPHPQLTRAQAGVVSAEFCAGQPSRVTTVRGALVHYYVQVMHLAMNVQIQCPPDYLLAVYNVEEVQPWMF